MNTHVTRITIPTDQLRALLPEEALVELQSIACEKIAEELRRKTTGDKLEATIKDISLKIADNCREDFLRTYRFPEPAKAIIREVAKGAVEDAVNAALAKAVRDVETRVEAIVARATADITAQSVRAVQESFDRRIRELDGRIETKARTEFLSVLKEAKEAGLCRHA